MRIIAALLLPLFCTASQANQPNELLNEQEMSYCTQKATEIINQCDLDFKEHSVLLNLLYHMYYFAQIDAVYRKNAAMCINLLEATQKNLDPTMHLNEELISQFFSQTMVLARRRHLHGSTWRLLEENIEQKHSEMLPTINAIKQTGQALVEKYAQGYTQILDDKIKQAKDTLNKTSQQELTIARTFDLIEQQPELFCGKYEMSGLEKIEMLYGLSNSIANNVQRLSEMCTLCKEDAFQMQLVGAAFFKICYQTLHEKISLDFPDNQLKVVIAQDGQLITTEDTIEAPQNQNG